MSEVLLVRPDILGSFLPNPLAWYAGKVILKSALEAERSEFEPNVSVLIRTKNEKSGLASILAFVRRTREMYKGRIDVLVVDTESKDGSKELGRDFGATVIDVKQEGFNYPRGLNDGLAEVRDDSEATYMTVGHAQPAVSNLLQAGIRHFNNENVTLVSGLQVPDAEATLADKIIYLYPWIYQNEHRVGRLFAGSVNNFSSMVRMETWRRHPFDESYAFGGEDLAWAKQAKQRLETIIYEPALMVHHSHKTSVANMARHMLYWFKVQRPAEFDETFMAKMRPDLFNN